MSRPSKIEFAYDKLGISLDLQQLISKSSVYVKKLRLDTSEISFAINIPDQDEGHILHFDSPASLNKYLPTLNDRLNDVNTLENLESLDLNITYWERNLENPKLTFFPDEELRWALKLLQHIPSEHIEEITLNIKVGGHTSQFEAAFAEFHSDQEFIWNDWAKEICLSKYSALQEFNIHIFGQESYHSDGPSQSLTQDIVERTEAQLYSALTGTCCALFIHCYISEIQCLIY